MLARRSVVLLAVPLLALAACGDDSSDTPASAGTAAPPSTAGSEPPATTAPVAGTAGAATEADQVTIEHVYGETVVEGVPSRIVSLDVQWTDVLRALDAPLVAAATDPTQGGWYPWQSLDGVEEIPLPADYSIPYEAIAALQPDLIVASWAADEASYGLLTEIAPTIPLLGERDVDPWEEIAAAAGDLLGRPDEAAALVAEAQQRSADLRAELPGLDGKSYAFANYVPGDAIYVVADPNDGASQLFAQLGMQIDPELLALEDGSTGRVELSLERIGELDSEVLLLLTNGADPAEIPGYSALPAVQSGAVAVLDFAAAVGLNTPTPLSVPYSLDLLRPALEAADAAAG